MSPEEQLRRYLKDKYKMGGKAMRLKDMAFECKKCRVYFTPSEQRAKALMIKNSVINLCRDCDEGEQ